MYEEFDRAIVGEIAIRNAKGFGGNLTSLYWAVIRAAPITSSVEMTLRRRLQALRKKGVIEHLVGYGWQVRAQ